MNKYIFSLLVLCLTLSAHSQVTWLQPVYDFGVFSEDLGSVDAKFQMVNNSNSPIRIIDARATCGCTRPKLPKGEILPGDTAEIQVTYLASGRPGRFSKNIYVKTSDKPSEQRTLTVRGTVIGSSSTLASRYPIEAGSMRLKSNNVAFGDVTRGRLKTIFLEAYNMSTDTVFPRIENLPEFIDVSITPDFVAPGEQTHISLTLQSHKVPDWGITQGAFSFFADENVEPIQIDYFTIINEDFSRLTPGQRLKAPIIETTSTRTDLGVISPSQQIQVEFEIKNSGQSNLLIRRLQATDEYVVNADISSEKIKPGKKATVKVTIDPAKASNDFISSRILIINNDPENSLFVYRITAEIQR